MDKKVTAIVGIALGATLAAGFGLYKYFSKKTGTNVGNSLTRTTARNVFREALPVTALLNGLAFMWVKWRMALLVVD